MLPVTECALYSLAGRARLVVQAFDTTVYVPFYCERLHTKLSTLVCNLRPSPIFTQKYARTSLVFPPCANLGRREQFGGDGKGAKNETPQPPTRSQGTSTNKHPRHEAKELRQQTPRHANHRYVVKASRQTNTHTPRKRRGSVRRMYRKPLTQRLIHSINARELYQACVDFNACTAAH